MFTEEEFIIAVFCLVVDEAKPLLVYREQKASA